MKKKEEEESKQALREEIQGALRVIYLGRIYISV